MNAVEKAWQEWLEGIEREFRFFKISEAADKKDAMIIYGGNEIVRLEKSLPDPETSDVYTKLRMKLSGHFTPKKNKHHDRYLFLKMRPHGRNYKRVCRKSQRKNERVRIWRYI